MLSVAVWRPQADFLISLGNLLSPGYANVSLLSLVHSAAGLAPLLDLVSNLMCAKPALEPKAPDCEPEPEPKPEAAPKKDVCCAPEGKPDDNPDAGGSAPSIRSSSSPLNTREEDRTADLLLYGLPPGDARVDPAAASPQAHEAAANAAAGAAAKCPVHGGRAPEGAGHGGSALPPPGAKQAPCWQYPCQACYEGRKQHPVWLHFKSIRLEEKFRLWHAQQLWKIDIIYNIIWFVLFLATSFTKPISLFARRPWAWLFAFPHMSSVIVMGINPRYYPQRREKAIMVVLIWTALYCTYVACPNMMATVPLERLQNATWQVRIIGAEALAVQPLGNKMRFWVFIPVQLTAVALASHGLRAACTSTWPAAAMSLCMSVNAAALFVVGFCMPAAAIWFLERRSRAIFLASPAATST
ncbi:hypothetical protein WJX72_004325 [[Myrmecia] bisecta]|uniref:Uncharacterized protein n=1 Tax=[Myrmecia] bisecta TaxID=41462 RepID=A0AAW1P7J0_9CHLO